MAPRSQFPGIYPSPPLLHNPQDCGYVTVMDYLPDLDMLYQGRTDLITAYMKSEEKENLGLT